MHATWSTSAKIALLVTTAAFGISMPIHRFGRQVEYSRHEHVAADISTLDEKLRVYEQAHHGYPPTSVGLRALDSASPALDPWRRPYVYRCPGLKNPRGYDLFSAGPDGAPGTADDDWGK